MLDATRLVRKGKLAEATQLIQDALGKIKDAPIKLDAGLSAAAQMLGRANVIEAETLRPAQARSGSRFEQHIHAGKHGSRPYKLYVPQSASTQAPLIVMLHGCTQSPDDFAAGTRMNEHAEARGFLVAYPGQTREANASRCWNWFEAGDQHPNKGEPAIIAGVIQEISSRHSVDPRRVFVAGLSAGGAAAANLAIIRPDLFAAVGVHSGLACGAARDMSSAFQAMQGGANAKSVKRAVKPVPAIVFHGDDDTTVNVRNGAQVVMQMTAGASASEVLEDGVTQGGRRYQRVIHQTREGLPLLEHWVVRGGAHAWFGGSANGSYTDPAGPDASREMVRFFLDRPGA
jgi:poly(hydroxyalkanoate) depolymerase family esterase